MTTDLETTVQALGAIVGLEHVRRAQADDIVDGVLPGLVVAPGTADETARVLKLADEAGLAVLPRGGGTKLGWGNRPERSDLVVTTSRMSAVVEHAWGDMTATVQAGCTIAELQRTLAEHGQRLALDPLFPECATVGGALATNDSGMLRVRYGSLRDQVIGVTVALADGTLAKSGGKVVKNVAGYDLPKLVVGALGTIGMLVEATFRLYPLPLATRRLGLTMTDTDTATRVLLAVLDSTLAPAAVQLQAGSDIPAQFDLLLEGLPAALDAQERLFAQISGSEPSYDRAQMWRANEELWATQGSALRGRVSVLPADIGRLCAASRRLAEQLRLHWRLAIGGLGVGWLRLESEHDEALLVALTQLRAEIAAMGGSLVAMGCPPSLKPRIDIWGEEGDALPLMRRVKERFDPRRTLNPGRFVGRI